jgi:hypothetical protein
MSKNEQVLQSLVSRTLRAAIKIGEDYYTIEETISLPPTASDDQIAQAVVTGLRIYEAQRTAVEAQLRDLREHIVVQPLPIQIKDPDAPASEKQRMYMDYLLKELHWDDDQLAAFAAEHMLDMLTLTKREASELIDELKALLDERTAGQSTETPAKPESEEATTAPVQQVALPTGERATQRQVRALERLVEERGVDLEGEMQARFGGRTLADLSVEEAGQLLSEWQQRPRVLRPTRRAA